MLSLQKAHKIAFDTETSDLNPMLASIVGLSFSTNAGSAWYIPVGHSEGLQLSLEYVIEQLKPIFENPDKQMCAHNANYDLMILSKYGIHVTNLTFDTMVGAHLLGNSSLGLKNLSQTLLGIDMQPITELIGTGKKQISFSDVSIEEAYPYAAADADCTLQLWNHFEPKIDSSFAKNIMSNIEMPLIPVIIEMQRNGITLEKDNLESMSKELQSDMEILHESIVSHVGHSLNINSPSQLSQVLFNELDLPKTTKPKTGN